MGVKTEWINNFQTVLSINGLAGELVSHDEFTLIRILDTRIVVNCISILNLLTAEKVVEAQEAQQRKGFQLINLWQDVWRCKRPQVMNRLRALSGQNVRLHGRNTKVITLNKHQADDFLSACHIQGPALARYKFGLLHNDELVAAATFSGTRLMRQYTEGYRSAELIRFATLPGFNVAGGLTKLIKHFAALVKTDDVMSYADRDWSNGKGYEAAGFTFHSLQPPSALWLDTSSNRRYFQHRFPKVHDGLTVEDAPEHYGHIVQIFNTGNLKYILYL